MHVKDVENLLLTASCQHFLVPRDPSEFVVEIEVSIDRYDGNQEQTVQMGGASLFLIDEQRVLDYGESLLEVMDAHSQELTDVYSALFDTEGDYREEFEEQDFLGRSLLYIDFLYLHPEYRGHRIGQLVMLGLIESFGAGADIVVTEHDPLYFHEEERNLKLELQKPATEELWTSVKRKLCDYWKPLGFLPAQRNQDILFLSRAKQSATVAAWLEKMGK
jgi:GNAT superfamily N-acetyltransferase